MTRQRCIKPFSFLWLLVLLVLSAPSFARAITVRVPGTDIIGGLSVDKYEIYVPDGYRRGCYIEVTFVRASGNDSIKAKNLRWLQLVSTNDPLWTNDPAQFDHFIDPQPDDDPLYYEPFYWTRRELLFYRSDSKFEFADRPFTTWDRRSEVDTQFELYLVRQLDHSIQVLPR